MRSVLAKCPRCGDLFAGPTVPDGAWLHCRQCGPQAYARLHIRYAEGDAPVASLLEGKERDAYRPDRAAG